MNKERESNFELLRIVCMIMIITGHTLSWGGILNKAQPNISAVIYIIYAIILVEVNCFILLTGYFQCKSKFKIKKFLNLLFTAYFYKVLITLLGYYLGWYTISATELIWQISPFDFSNYWFINIYLILYCLSPFINKFINCISRKNFRNLLIILFVFCSVLVTVTNQQIFINSSGFSLVQFVFMYLIGSYLSKYVLTDTKKEELYTNKKKLIKNLCVTFSIFIICFILNYTIFKLGDLFMKSGGGFTYLIGHRLNSVFMNYDNPLVILGAVGLFSFFSFLKFKNKFINKVSAVILSVYLIHETVIFRPILYSFFGLNKLKTIGSYKIFINLIFIVLTIFIGCVIIEYIRKFIFGILKKVLFKINLISKTNENYNNLCKKIDLWFNN